MIELFLALLIGALFGYIIKPKSKDIQEQLDIYNRTYQKYEEEIKYYKDLCKWHVEQGRKK